MYICETKRTTMITRREAELNLNLNLNLMSNRTYEKQ